MRPRTTDVKFRDWPWHARLIERLYRITHGGQIRTLVLSDDQARARDFFRAPRCSTARPGTGAICTCPTPCDNYWIRARRWPP
jgi:hypothetical protein